ncbi:MAG TPA: dTDP-glucose 4,6-dehydratase [Cryomorphaceae bacterium]|nr:dTDP-glucose 4,6-dehydratase [Cryomorphaceae bacterium]
MSDQKKILITGGAGFIGSHVVRLFVNKYPDYQIYNLDALTYAGNLENLKDIESAENYHFIKADIVDAHQINQLFGEHRFDSVIHLAAESHVDRSITDPLAFVRTNVIGTVNLLNAFRDTWKDNFEGKLFYHISTDEVYGTLGETGLFEETTAYDPNSPYSASKASSDHFVRAYGETYGLPHVVTNCSNNYGSHQHPEKLIPLAIKSLINNRPIPVYGSGENVRDWIFVEDHVDALIEVILKGKLGESYCIGAGQLKTNEEILKSICDLLDVYNKGNSPHIRFKKYVKDRPGHDQRYALDNRKIINELKWQPKYNFHEGIELTVKWYLNNTQWLNQLF